MATNRVDGVTAPQRFKTRRSRTRRAQVPFEDNFRMEGAVEVWLNELVTFMRDTLRGCLVNALEEASLWDTDRAREEWVAFHCAQIALITSQIVWTEETETALDDLENGTDDAVKKYLDVSDAAQKMNLNLNLNLTWSRRWRRGDAAPS